MLVAVILSMVTDVSTEDTRLVKPPPPGIGCLLRAGNAAQGRKLTHTQSPETWFYRAVLFMRVQVASLVGNLASPALSSALMNMVGPWPVMWLAVAGLFGAAAMFMLVPESLHRDRHDKTSDYEPARCPDGDAPAAARAETHFLRTLSRLTESLSMLKSPSLVMLLVAIFLTQPMSPATTQLLIQYMSKQFRVRIEDIGYAQTAYGAVQVFQALVGLPVVSRLMTMKSSLPSSPTDPDRPSRSRRGERLRRWRRRPFKAENGQHRDLVLARWSFLVLVPGFLLMGMAPTIPWFVLGLLVTAVGSGYGSLAKSLMSLYVDPEHRSRLFTLDGMVETAGLVYSGPMLAAFFSLGMKLGSGGDGDGSWTGLPYYVLAAMTAAASILLMFVRLPRTAGRNAPSTAADNEVD